MAEAEGSFAIIFPSAPKYLTLARCAMQNMLMVHGFSSDEIEEIVLAVDEALSNVIKHAYGGREEDRIYVSMRVDEHALEVVVKDFAEGGADPAEFKPRDLADLKSGGLGTHFRREVMDEVTYFPSLGEGHILKMTKKRSSRGASA